jgi:hypothetical protein
MSPDSATRALDALSDLLELIRLAQGAAQRLSRESAGSFEAHAGAMVNQMHQLRRLGQQLQPMICRAASGIQPNSPQVPLSYDVEHGLRPLESGSDVPEMEHRQ